MRLDAYVPHGGYWSSPFVKWQGALASQHPLKLAASCAQAALGARGIDVKAARKAAGVLAVYTGADIKAICTEAGMFAIRENRDFVLGLGADKVIDYTAEDFTLASDRYDLIFDAPHMARVAQTRVEPEDRLQHHDRVVDQHADAEHQSHHRQHVKSVAHEIEKAEEELEKASEASARGDPDKAIDHHKHAWEHAQEAIEHAP